MHGETVKFIIVQFSAGARDFLLQSIQTSSGSHPASYSVGFWGALSQGLRWPWCEVEQTPPANAEFEHEYWYNCT